MADYWARNPSPPPQWKQPRVFRPICLAGKRRKYVRSPVKIRIGVWRRTFARVSDLTVRHAAEERNISWRLTHAIHTADKCFSKWSSNKTFFFYCIPRPPAAAQPYKVIPSTCLPICLRTPLPRAANKLESKWKVRITKNHQDRHSCHMCLTRTHGTKCTEYTKLLGKLGGEGCIAYLFFATQAS